MKYVDVVLPIIILTNASCSQAQDFEISQLPHEIALNELANFTPEGVGEEVRVRARVELDGETLVLRDDDDVIRVSVSPTKAEMLACVSENELAHGQVSLYFNPRVEGAVVTTLVALDAQTPDQIPDFADILCADIDANNVLARNAAELRE